MNKRYFVHDRAWVESDNIGKSTRIWAFTHIMKGSKIGSNCNIGEHCFIENEVIIGDGVKFSEQIVLGLYYLENRSLKLDLEILLNNNSCCFI